MRSRGSETYLLPDEHASFSEPHIYFVIVDSESRVHDLVFFARYSFLCTTRGQPLDHVHFQPSKKQGIKKERGWEVGRGRLTLSVA